MLGTSPEPDPDLELYAFEAALEAAVVSAAGAYGFFSVYTQGSSEKLQTPWAGVQVSSSGQQGTQKYIVAGTNSPGNVGPWAYQQFWKCKLRITIAANRLTQSREHHRVIGAFRRIMDAASIKINPLMPDHKICGECVASGSSFGFNQDLSQNLTTLEYEVPLSINGNKFPTPS